MCTALSANLATAHQGHHSIVLRAPTDWAHSRIAQSYNSDDSYAILQLFMCEPPTRLLLVEKRWFMSISNLINFKYCAGNATFFNSLDGSFSRVIVSVIPAVFSLSKSDLSITSWCATFLPFCFSSFRTLIQNYILNNP